MRHAIVRYTVKPADVERNEELVRAVYAELQDAAPEGFRYATYRLDDGVTFVHVAARSDPASNPLSELSAFRRFQQDIGARCVVAPVVSVAQQIGAYSGG
jgi:hypothetical protein